MTNNNLRKPTKREVQQLVFNLARRANLTRKYVQKDLKDDCDIAVFDHPTQENPLSRTMVVVRDHSIIEIFRWDTHNRVYALPSDWGIYLYPGTPAYEPWEIEK